MAHSLQLMFYELELNGEPLGTSSETINKEEEEERDRRTSTDLPQNSVSVNL